MQPFCPFVHEIVLLKQSHKKCRLEISAYNLNLSKETVCKFFACYSQLLARSATLFETIQSGHVVVCTLEFLINKQHSYFRKFFSFLPFFSDNKHKIPLGTSINAERTKQMEQILNFQVPTEGLQLVILLREHCSLNSTKL